MDQNQTFRPKIGGWRGWLVNDGDCICASVRTWWGRGFALNRSDHQIITFLSLSSDQPCDEQDFQWWSYNSLFWPPSCLFNEQCSSLSPWCQCSMSFDLSLLLITNVSPSVGNNKSPFDIFAVYGSWTSTRPPMMILMRAVDHLSSRLISDHPHHHLVPGATCSVWVWGTLTPKRIHPRVLAFSFILPLSFEHFFFRTAYSLLVCVYIIVFTCIPCS